jgi:hypothetical protein
MRVTTSTKIHTTSRIAVQCLQRFSVMVLTFAFLVAGSSRAHAQWIEARSAHYSIFYAAGFENDAMFTRTWLDRAEQLMKDK